MHGDRSASVLATVAGVAVALLPVVIVFGLPARLGVFVFDEQVAVLLLGIGLALVFLRGRDGAPVWLDRLLAAGSLAFGAGLALRFPVLSEGAFFRPVEAGLFGLAAVVLIVEGTRRVIGWTLIAVFGALVAYALLGSHLPDWIAPRAMAPWPLLGFLGTDSAALMGQTLRIACFVILPFVLFGRLLVAVGAAEVFEVLGARLSGRGPGGSGRVALVSSLLFGTVSGSAVANVMANGTVTIPMMRRNGYAREDAAAAEAVASTGGQIMPPVMGAAAFIMAEYLRLPYATVMLAAVIPALLFYLAIWLQLEFLARRMGLPAFSEVATRPLSAIRIEAVLLAAAFLGLLGGIFWGRLPAEVAALCAAALLAAAGLILLRRRGFGLRRLLHEIARTGIGAADVLLICALAGMVIGLLGKTGLGFTLSMLLLEIGRSSLLALLAITALVSLVMGMGMPTTAVYLLLATLAAPTLIQLGIPPIAAHLFVFYYGMLSMITPPVALAAFAAASIAQAAPIRVGLHAVRMGWVAFLVPFLFVYQPGLLMQGSALAVLGVVLAALVAVPLITAALVGHGLAPLSPLARLVALGLGCAALFPADRVPGGQWTEAAVVVTGAVCLAAAWRRGQAPAPIRQD